MIIVRSQRWPERDRKRRKYIVKFEYIKSILRSLISHSQWSRKFKYSFLKRFYKITRSHSISYCRNNCSTHRVGGSTYRFSRMSRYATKYYASWGYFVGIRRSSFQYVWSCFILFWSF